LVWRERGADDAVCEVVDALSGEIFDLLGVHIVDQGVDGDISSLRIFLRCAEAHDGDAGVAFIHLLAQVDKVQAEPKHLGRRSLEVLALVWVGCNLGNGTCGCC